MVTHNANLVVNTDVDQVIVASCGGLEAGRLPDLRYESGGLEDETIRASVCQILEGGETAFRQCGPLFEGRLAPADLGLALIGATFEGTHRRRLANS